MLSSDLGNFLMAVLSLPDCLPSICLTPARAPEGPLNPPVHGRATRWSAICWSMSPINPAVYFPSQWSGSNKWSHGKVEVPREGRAASQFPCLVPGARVYCTSSASFVDVCRLTQGYSFNNQTATSSERCSLVSSRRAFLFGRRGRGNFDFPAIPHCGHIALQQTRIHPASK